MPIATHTWSGTVGFVNRPTDDGDRELVCGPGQAIATEPLPLPLCLTTPRGIVRVGDVTRVERDGTAINAAGSIAIDKDADWWAVHLLYGQSHLITFTITEPLVHISGGRAFMTGWKLRTALLTDSVAWRDAAIFLTDLPEQQPAVAS